MKGPSWQCIVNERRAADGVQERDTALVCGHVPLFCLICGVLFIYNELFSVYSNSKVMLICWGVCDEW